MLFLLNNQVMDLELPEHRLARRWRVMGCGDPSAMRARDAVDFARQVVDDTRAEGVDLTLDCMLDIGALIVAKTGANAAQFVPRPSGTSDVRINTFNETVLQIFRDAQIEAQAQLEAQLDTPSAETIPLPPSPWTSAVA
ncbi:MAG: hypothetical protein AAF253_09975 [Pseudomonadota bacterium]